MAKSLKDARKAAMAMLAAPGTAVPGQPPEGAAEGQIPEEAAGGETGEPMIPEEAATTEQPPTGQPPEGGVPEGEVPEETQEGEQSEGTSVPGEQSEETPEETQEVIEALKDEVKRLSEENEELKKAVSESGEIAGESITAIAQPPEGAAEAADEYPSLDITAIMYGSDEDAKNAKDAFVKGMLGRIERDAQPIMQRYSEAKQTLAREDAAKICAAMEELAGFNDVRPRLERMIDGNEMLKSWTNPTEQYITAYLINKGAEALQKEGSEPDIAELMEMYHGNEQFRNAVEQERLDALKARGDVPPTPAGTGLSAAEPYKYQAPKTMAEAKKNVRKMFGV